MAYLRNENNEIIIDAILTDYGRQKLAKNSELGITRFALSDDEIDYNLYNTSHTGGELWYDVAIRELPILEAIPNSKNQMKYKLFTTTDGTSGLYTILVNVPSKRIIDSIVGIKYTFIPSIYPEINSTLFYMVEMKCTNSNILEYINLVADEGVTEGTAPNELILKRNQYSQFQGYSDEFKTSKIAFGNNFYFSIKSNLGLKKSETLTFIVSIGSESGIAVPVIFNVTILPVQTYTTSTTGTSE